MGCLNSFLHFPPFLASTEGRLGTVKNSCLPHWCFIYWFKCVYAHFYILFIHYCGRLYRKLEVRRCFPAGGKLQGTRLKMDFGFVEQAVCKQMHLDSVLAFSRYTVFALFLIKMDGKYWGCSLGFAIIAINILNSALVNSQKDKWEGSHQVGSQVETLCLRLL